MIKTIEDYKKNKKKEAEKLKKELSMIEYNQKILKGEDILDPKNLFKPKYTDDNPEFKLIKEKYFNSFKDKICPLKIEYPILYQHLIELYMNSPISFNEKCPYAHNAKELKFEKEISEKIKLKKNLLEAIEKDSEPFIDKKWIPSGPLIPCLGCGKKKTLCNYCKYHKQTDELTKKEKLEAKKIKEQSSKDKNNNKIKI
jgi:hypothetical protein